MKNSCFIVLFLLGIIPSAFAQLIGFEEEVPEAFTVSGKGEVKISSLFYKEGESSLEWDFQLGSTLDIQIAPLSLNARNEKQFGITLWIYNEKPQQDSIRFEFLNKAGEVSYWFSYRLQAAGWRACWISFEYMQGDKKDKKIVAYRLVAPLPIMGCLIVTCGIGVSCGNGNNSRMISLCLLNCQANKSKN